MKIKSIKIEAFRGISYLERDIEGRSMLIYGENGTGKSSIVDAIEFFFTGKISHPSPFKLRDHAPHINFTSEDLKIKLVFDPGNISLERKLSPLLSYPTSLQELFQNAANGKFILRRSEILKFIESSPGKRYEFIGNILGIKKLEKIEDAMREAKNYLQTELNIKIGELNKVKLSINSNLNENIEKIEDILPILNKKLKDENFEILTSLEELKDYADKLEKGIEPLNIQKISALESIFRIQTKIIPLNVDILEKFKEIEKIKNEIIINNQLNELSLIEILENSKKIIDEKTEECPLCSQGIDGKEILEKINIRLNELKKLKIQNDQLINLVKKVKESLRSVQRYFENILSNLDIFNELTEEKNVISQEIIVINSFLESITTNLFLQGKISADDYLKLKNSQEELLIKLQIRVKELNRSLVQTEVDEKKSEISKLFLDINKQIKEHNTLNGTILKLQHELVLSEKIHNTFSKIRKRKIQEIYDSIEEDIQYFYSKLHPNDLHENIKLNIDLSRRASTNLRMTIFGREDEDPRSLSSEGHLDSLGLCIFLALFKNFNKDFPILILDDVVSTIDSRHRENVCDLLLEEFSNKQFIITTHDGIWFEQIKAAQRAYSLGSKFENLQITKWDINGGPTIRPYKPRWEKIKDKIDEGDRNCAGNEGRHYLEWLLEHICTNSKAAVKMNPAGRFEVNDLFDPARQRLNKLIKDPEFKGKIIQSFRVLEKTRIVGNLMSHENLLAGNISMEEVEHFCESVHEIHKLMICDNCENPLKYYQELKIFRCSNERCSNPLEIKAK